LLWSYLDAVWLKIARAKEHSDSLQQEARRKFAIEENCPRLSIKFDPDSGEYVLLVNQMPELGLFLDRCSLILGDVVHNLVSSLDRLAYRLAELHAGGTPKNPTSVLFPICDSAEAFAKAGRRRLVEVNPIHSAIIERLQPYNGINNSESAGIPFRPLSLLRDLASVDKHRLPIELTAFNIEMFVPIHIDFGDILFAGKRQQLIDRGVFVNPHPLKLGTEIVRAKFPMGQVEPDVEVAGYIIPQIALTEGWAVSDITSTIAAVTINIVREFEPVFQ
jgi:hypothetical protein